MPDPTHIYIKVARAIALALIPFAAVSQSTNVSLNPDYYHWIERYEIKAGRVAPELFTAVKPWQRKAVVEFLDSLRVKDSVFTSRSDRFNYEYITNDNWEWSQAATSESKKPVLRHFYKKKSDLYHVDVPDFDLHVNPVFYFGSGTDNRLNESIYTNTRGVEIRGMVDRKIGFYTFLTDNQAILPYYVHQQMELNPVVPHETYWKTFKTNGVDFFQARAYIDFNLSKHINFQFGHDRTFVGNGVRSLILSDYSPPNLFLRPNLKVWKINYLFQINRLTADAYGTLNGSRPNIRYPDKYMAFHHASINIGKKFTLGVFESVIFSAQDSTKGGAFDVGYLNPVIFYRAIEQQFGSADNVILGGDFKYNVAKRLQFYGQIVIDEFVLSQAKSGSGWWANKFGGQIGMKYIDVAGISNLDLQLEVNAVRPYTYSHDMLFSNYSNYRQSLAHPMGANFKELVSVLRYQPLPRLNLVLKTFYTKIGRDTTTTDWGSNMLINNKQREQDYGNTIGQGIKNTIAFADFTASFHLRHNLFIDLKQIIRTSSSPAAVYNYNNAITSLSVRLNIAPRAYDF